MPISSPPALEYTTAVFNSKHLPVVVSYTLFAKSLLDIFVDRKTSNDGLTLISTRLMQFNGWKHGRALNPQNRNNVPNDNRYVENGNPRRWYGIIVSSVCTRRGVRYYITRRPYCYYQNIVLGALELKPFYFFKNPHRTMFITPTLVKIVNFNVCIIYRSAVHRNLIRGERGHHSYK